LRALELIKREAGADNVVLTMGLVGVHAANYPVNLIHLWNGGPEEVWIAVQFRPGVRVPELREKLRAVFAKELAEARVSFEPSDIVSRVMSFGSSTPIEVAVSGPDLVASRAHAEKLPGENADHSLAPRCADRTGIGFSLGARRGEPRTRGPARRARGGCRAFARGGHDVVALHHAGVLGGPEDRRELQRAGADSADDDEVRRGSAQHPDHRQRWKDGAAAQRRDGRLGHGGRAITSATTWRAR